MSFAVWALIAGAILLTMALLGTLLERLPLSPGILYLVIGYALGPAGWALMTPDPLLHSAELETLAEIALLISLFSVGLKLGVPLRDRRWYLPLRLAFPSMALTVIFVTAISVVLLGLPVGAAILLAAILAPTDPVLASDVQVEHSSDRDRLRFGLTAEGGLNDGAAFPLVLLALGLMGLHDFGSIWRWIAVDVVWSILGGLAIGGALGALVGKLVLYLRTRHQEAVGLDEFLALGLIAIAFGVAQLSMTSGFLAVFTAGLALQRVKANSKSDRPLRSAAKVTMTLGAEGEKEIATNVHHAGTCMMDAVLSFNGQLERLAELVVVMVAGAMLVYTYLPERAIWFLLLLFLVARPLSVWLGLLGATSVSRDQRILISWFGIRGVGSIFYLMYAINHGLPAPLADELIAITLTTVAASILLHGISVTPLMALYAKRKTHSRQ
ncbi:MAG: cation:proton antiporter [Betaproteobacteria bacterium]|nr:cation:proton antiporter [Betaproteobacteria bacterium]